MKRRCMILVQLFFSLSVMILACSKDRSLKLSGVKSELEISAIPPDPMPPDSLLLDTLDSPGYR